MGHSTERNTSASGAKDDSPPFQRWVDMKNEEASPSGTAQDFVFEFAPPSQKKLARQDGTTLAQDATGVPNERPGEAGSLGWLSPG
jgi:hypothetical protein